MSRVESNRLWRDMPALPAVSVVMIGHRSAALLSRAVFSLLRHTAGKEWELVLIVNGDCAEVADWARELRQSERVAMTVVHVSERRPGAARNAGVREARAPVLFFLDDDIECFQDVVGAAIELFRTPRSRPRVARTSLLRGAVPWSVPRAE